MKKRLLVSSAILLTLITGCGRQNPRNEQPATPQPNSNQQQLQTQGDVPSPAPQSGAPPFLMAIDDKYPIVGRGVTVTGVVERGEVRVNDQVEIIGIQPTKKALVTGVEMFKKITDVAVAGDKVGVLLRGIESRDIQVGQVIAKPGSISPHTTFKAKIDVLTKEEGGRSTPFFNGYRPQFFLRTADVTGVVRLPEGMELVMPGDKNVEVEVELIVPIALEKDFRFRIREGGRTIATGILTSILK